MPRSLKSLEGCPTHRTKLTTYEKVKRARRQYYSWRKKQEEKHAFNEQQATCARLNPTGVYEKVPLNKKEVRE